MSRIRLLFALVAIGSYFLLPRTAEAAPASGKPLIVAYVFPQETVLQPGQVNPHSITRINYAFANIKDGRLVEGFPSDTANLALLTSLRKQNPSLTVLISVGGWAWSGGFTYAARTAQSRARFIHSAVEFIRAHHLDGLDIDWEYPGLPGAGHAYRADDKRDFTSLLKETRAGLDRLSKETGRRMYLTIAAGASDNYLEHTQMGDAQRYLDTVNVMAYDYYEPASDEITGLHAPLYPNTADPEHISADDSVRAFERAGVPAEKLLLGVPFYGHIWGSVPDRHHGLYQPGKQIPGAFTPYSVIESNMLGKGFTRYWDEQSQAPYLYDPARRIFVSYEDPQSIAVKCKYVLRHHLGGVMFWTYLDDPSGAMVRSIDSSLNDLPTNDEHGAN